MTSFLQSSPTDIRRSQKMQSVHRELEPSSQEIVQRLQAARSRRYLKSQGSRIVTIPALRGLALGLLLSGSAFAWAVQSGRVHISSQLMPTHRLESTSLSPAPTLPPPVRVLQPPVRALDNNSTPGEMRHETPSAIETPSSTAQRPRPSVHEPAPTIENDKEAATWAAVVASMRRGESAETELKNLEESEDPKTREAATLLKLQLEEKRRALNEQELATLKTLSESGLSPSVRASARRLHEKLIAEKKF